ncbi:hypothetical protein CHUAL_001162 [Chamberlinius hualienensis]
MGSQQQFCLRWNNHQSNMLTVFDNLFQNEALVDVTLACEGLSLKAHKMVLSACSPFFQSLFIDNPCKHPIVILKDVRYSDLKALVDFMYKGEVNVSQDQLNRLLKTAETLKVRGLAEVTSGYCIEENGTASSALSAQDNRANNSQPLYENRTSRSPLQPTQQQQQQQQQQQHQLSPPRKRKKTKHRGKGDKHTSHSEQEESDGAEMLEPKVEITEDNFACDKNAEQNNTRHNQESPRKAGDDRNDSAFPAGPSITSTPNARGASSILSVQNQSTLSSGSQLTGDDQLSNQSSLHNASPVYLSPGHDVAQISTEYTTTSLSYKRPKGGRPTILYEEEEDEIVQYIERKAGEGNPVDIRKILNYGNNLLRREGRRPTGSMYMHCSETVKGLSIKWWRGFKKRHPGLPYTRQKSFLPDEVGNSLMT